jgi:hypothetical protein
LAHDRFAPSFYPLARTIYHEVVTARYGDRSAQIRNHGA